MKFLLALLVALIFAPAHAQTVGPKIGYIASLSAITNDTGGLGPIAMFLLVASNGVHTPAAQGCASSSATLPWFLPTSTPNYEVFFAQLLEAGMAGREVHVYGTVGTGGRCIVNYISIH